MRVINTQRRERVREVKRTRTNDQWKVFFSVIGKYCGAIVRRLVGLKITAGCDTAWIRTRDCSDASCTEMQCLRPLRPCVCVCVC